MALGAWSDQSADDDVPDITPTKCLDHTIARATFSAGNRTLVPRIANGPGGNPRPRNTRASPPSPGTAFRGPQRSCRHDQHVYSRDSCRRNAMSHCRAGPAARSEKKKPKNGPVFHRPWRKLLWIVVLPARQAPESKRRWWQGLQIRWQAIGLRKASVSSALGKREALPTDARRWVPAARSSRACPA